MSRPRKPVTLKLQLPERRVPHFKPGKSLRLALPGDLLT